MKNKIHPKYYKDAVQRCACGTTFHIPSTKKESKIEICSKCHPFYTGKSKIVDTAGQVEKFRKRTTKTTKIQGIKKEKKVERTKSKAVKKPAKKK